ncbi:uncharacterized protein LAESUDRAFT_730807 [Laetiporus sulphureus 93-53]|uniref:Uncharacterized protein n=1 Tax=Laetiporus sulphureus 93-53 TaxID=1314785 RepID=A0A165BZ05_9APHY|nr:uncharacterized protein LAESUDRAFT_730807 [Laetiporus sulphureus 93-53]KZT01906.1 hypothetical protein LAESUDRAFT_730807 [Laetiporus sulphureus 93-53]
MGEEGPHQHAYNSWLSAIQGWMYAFTENLTLGLGRSQDSNIHAGAPKTRLHGSDMEAYLSIASPNSTQCGIQLFMCPEFVHVLVSAAEIIGRATSAPPIALMRLNGQPEITMTY